MLLSVMLAHAVQQPRSFTEACLAAPAVAIVEVTGQEGRWSQVGIETWIDVVVIDPLFGTLPESLSVVVIGGKVGEISMLVPDTPKLRTDHRYTLLLQPRADGRYGIYGGVDGVSTVLGGCDVAR